MDHLKPRRIGCAQQRGCHGSNRPKMLWIKLQKWGWSPGGLVDDDYDDDGYLGYMSFGHISWLRKIITSRLSMVESPVFTAKHGPVGCWLPHPVQKG